MTAEPPIDAPPIAIDGPSDETTVRSLEALLLKQYGTPTLALRQVLLRVLIADELLGSVERGLVLRGRLRPDGTSVHGLLVSFILGGEGQ